MGRSNATAHSIPWPIPQFTPQELAELMPEGYVEAALDYLQYTLWYSYRKLGLVNLPCHTASAPQETMPKKPTIIIVHGAYHRPEHFDAVVGHLHAAGYETLLPRLPSVGLSSDPGGALHLDAAVVRDALKQVIVDNGRDAVLVMHSYGGVAGTEGYGMFREAHSPQDVDSAQVRRLVYLAAHGAHEKGIVHRPDAAQLPHISVDVRSTFSFPLEHTANIERRTRAS